MFWLGVIVGWFAFGVPLVVGFSLHSGPDPIEPFNDNYRLPIHFTEEVLN